ncbi:hypothetical protein DL93DRAFT_2234230 [Clavulina sp. PMI_390]|nr:hypothetical protein DL93DRAFT_2234230 [Clavulina sp. PMI_390]
MPPHRQVKPLRRQMTPLQPQVQETHYEELIFKETDSDISGNYPEDTTGRRDQVGLLDYTQRVLSSDPRHIQWRKRVGRSIAEENKLPGDAKCYIMSQFPEGYELYVRVKERRDGSSRRDAYLYGHRNGSFRSIVSFLPHANWLYNGEGQCECDRCRATSQQVSVAQSSGITSLQPTSTACNRRSTITSATNPHSDAITKSLTVSGSASSASSRPESPHTSDAEASEDQTKAMVDLSTAAMFRKGELVWAAVSPAITDSLAHDDVILYWPAIVINRAVKPQCRDQATDIEVPHYQVEYLGNLYRRYTPESDIIPYISYTPPSTLTDNIKKYRPPSKWSQIDATAAWKAFWPISTSSYSQEGSSMSEGCSLFEAAIPALILSMEIANQLSYLYRPIFPRLLPGAKPLEMTPTPKAPAAGQHIWHGLMWRGERIWTGDLVRLGCLQTEWSDKIQACLEEPLPASLIVGEGVMFLLIENILSGDISSDDGRAASVFITGSIWQAVSGRWNEERELFPDSVSAGFVLPPPPYLSRWRMISRIGERICVPAELISGRYYPQILHHPKLGVPSETLSHFLGSEVSKSGLVLLDIQAEVSLALAGLRRLWNEHHNALRPYHSHRQEIDEARALAGKLLWETVVHPAEEHSKVDG